MTLDWLLAPIGRNTFVDSYWAKSRLVIHRNSSNYYERLGVERDIDHLLFISSRLPGSLEVLSGEVRRHSTSRRLDAAALLKKGRSLRINGIQKFSKNVSKLCVEMEQELSFPVNGNLYISPPDSPKALKRHFDTHDVFILQIAGRKEWRLFEVQNELPIEFLPLLQHESVRDMKKNRLSVRPNQVGEGKQTDGFTMTPGDLLYLPRGTPHEAMTVSDEVSCHLTVGVSPITYMDLITVALARAADSDQRLRQSLPVAFMTQARSYAVMDKVFGDLVDGLPGLLDSKAGASQLLGAFQRNRRSSLESQALQPLALADIHQLTLDSCLRMREGIVVSIDFGTSPVRLLVADRRFNLDDRFVEACQYIIARRYFCPRMLPGNLTDELKLEFVRLLTAAGIVVSTASSLDFSCAHLS